MASGVYYNQEVTAEMLNGIAADLGHTSFNGFSNKKFGANELNKITGDLVSAGILTSGNMCRVIKDNNGNIIVQTGIIVFANGAKMEIDSPVTVDADVGTVIYALNDTLQGKCSIEVAQSYPSSGDFIKLCSVNADGTLTDNRIVAKAKMELYVGNTEHRYTTAPFAYVKNDNVYSATTLVPKTIFEKYKYIIIIGNFPMPMTVPTTSAVEISTLPSTKFCAIYHKTSNSEDGSISLEFRDNGDTVEIYATTKCILAYNGNTTLTAEYVFI